MSETSAARRVVMLCPYFPPSASVAAKRAVRFVRHLPAHGWQPLVVTVEGSAGSGYDRALEKLLPPELFVSRDYAGSWLWRVWRRWEDAKASARGRGEGAKRTSASRLKALESLADLTYHWTPLDQFIIYLQSATRAAVRVAREQKAQAIYATSIPASALVAAVLAGQQSGLPVILDLRDPWTLDPLHFAPKPAPLRYAEEQLERLCVGQAARIIVNTERARRAYVAKYPGFVEKFVTLHNGFDRGLFHDTPPVSYEGFALVHFGNFFWHRTLESVLRVMARGPQELRLVTYGAIRPEDLALARELGLAARVEARPAVPFSEGLSVLRGAGALLLIQSEQTDLQIPAKLYDYLCAERPILALSGNPEIAEILRDTNAGICVSGSDEAALGDALQQLQRSDRGPIQTEALSRFEASHQTAQLAGWLSQAVTRR